MGVQIYPWQQSIKNHLFSLLKVNQFPQSILFSGVDGVGKFAFAKYCAKALLCLSPTQDAKFCGQCANCKLFDCGNHPDYLLLEPEGKAQQIKIDQIRGLNVFSQKTPQLNTKQVIIINHANTMNIAASNALLKKLEEPNQQTVIILISNKINRLLATILSRCQKFKMEAPSLPVAKEWLLSQGVDQNNVETSLFLAFSAPLQALMLIEENVVDAFSLWCDSWARLCSREISMQQMIRDVAAIEINHQLFFAQLFLSDLCRYLSTGQQERRYFPWQLVSAIDVQALFPLIDSVAELEVQRHIVSGLNVNLQWQNIVINWLKIVRRYCLK